MRWACGFAVVAACAGCSPAPDEVHGRLVDARSKQGVNARIRVIPNGVFQTRTDGGFDLYGDAWERLVFLEAKGYGAVFVVGSALNGTVELEPTTRLTGVVREADGSAVAGADLFSTTHREEPGRLPQRTTGKSAADGSFAFDGFVPSELEVVTGTHRLVRRRLALDGTEPFPIEVVLPPTGTVRGAVKNRDGTVRSDVWVTIENAGYVNLLVDTRTGEFRAELMPGEYQLAVDDDFPLEPSSNRSKVIVRSNEESVIALVAPDPRSNNLAFRLAAVAVLVTAAILVSIAGALRR